MYSSARSATSSPRCFTSPTTPTISYHCGSRSLDDTQWNEIVGVDDLVPLRIALAERHALANRALVRPMLPRERIVHHCHTDAGERIAAAELAAADDRNPHHREIPVRDEANLFLRLILRPLHATPFDVKRAAA